VKAGERLAEIHVHYEQDCRAEALRHPKSFTESRVSNLKFWESSSSRRSGCSGFARDDKTGELEILSIGRNYAFGRKWMQELEIYF
jgi:hypothetical protein